MISGGDAFAETRPARDAAWQELEMELKHSDFILSFSLCWVVSRLSKT